MFCFHKWSEWREVKSHLERECLKCGKVKARYPDPFSVLLLCVRDVILKHIEMKYEKRLKERVLRY